MKYKLVLFTAVVFAAFGICSGCSKKTEEIAPEETTGVLTQTLETTSEESAAAADDAIAAEAAPTRNTVTAQAVADLSLSEAAAAIAFKPLNQYPELPTGCEITSLAMVLNHMGLDADKCDLADNYLIKGAVGTVDFNRAFEGDPRDADSYGCYAPVIVETANKYLYENGSSMRAKNMTGTELEELFGYISGGTPVIVWGTLDCREGHYSVTWNVDGKDLTWFTPEHCMVLTGFDYGSSTVQVADPVHGDIRSYDMQTFKARYNSLSKQAVIIG